MRCIAAAVLGVVILAGTSASAHHGYAGFYMDRTVTIEGNIESIVYANPHVIFEIRTADSKLYTVTWQAARWVESRAGVTAATFKAGDHVFISAAPPRDPASRELASIRELRRPSDGWDWKRQPPPGQLQ